MYISIFFFQFILLGIASLKEIGGLVVPSSTTFLQSSILSLSFHELATFLQSKHDAKLCWEAYRTGKDITWELMSSSSSAAAVTASLLLGTTNNHTILHTTTCHDGTMKFVIQWNDGMEIETVIIPWPERNSSTVCISSQVGCRQACTFCLTGRMGLLRNLSVHEILLQVYYAIRMTTPKNDEDDHHRPYAPPIQNIVFMGLGEPADNVENVLAAVQCLTDPNRFAFASRKITISTVGPTPQSFVRLSEAAAVLAWSVHASRDSVRKQLVPTTQYSMVELREGLQMALSQRSKRRRTVLMEITLVEDINDSIEDANHLIEFCQPLLQTIPGTEIIINLIPWNNIQVQTGVAAYYRKPSMERILAFQQAVLTHGQTNHIRCFIRKTRGDDEFAACGQLSTKKKIATTTLKYKE